MTDADEMGEGPLDPTDHPGDLLSAHIDGELPGPAARQVEAHLVQCGACSAEVDALADARRRLRELPPVPAPPGLVTRLVERRRHSSRRGAALALAAAGVAVVVGLTVAEPADDRTASAPPRALTGDSSRLDTTATTPSPLAAPTGPGDAVEAEPPEPSESPESGGAEPPESPEAPAGGPDELPESPEAPPAGSAPGGTTAGDPDATAPGGTAPGDPDTTPSAPAGPMTTAAPGPGGGVAGESGESGGSGGSDVQGDGAGNGTGSEETSDPVTIGDRLGETATNLLEMIGG